MYIPSGEIREPDVLCTVYRAGDDDSVSSDDYGEDSDADSGEQDC